jgi:autotransporter-associated beta strand protein
MTPQNPSGVRSRRAVILLALFFCASAAYGSYQTITNDAFYLTTAGTSTPIYAQGGGISKFGNTYYWYGMQYAGMATYYKNPTTANADANTTFVAINCYTSTDFVHWTFQNKIISTSTPGFTSGVGWVGRMGQVVYNGTSGQYVTWFQYTGSDGSGQICCTGTSPTANFVENNVQTSITNVYYNTTGDCTIFCDTANANTPYLVFSDSHGREHLYVSPLSSTFLSIEPATLISEWPQGQEANNMFQRNGLYYACMSNLAGWSYSSAYEVSTPSILTPSDYTADATFQGTQLNDTYYSQISFVVPIQGNLTTSYILVGDRWSQNDSTYLSAGHGLGFNIMSPVTFNGTTPTFVPMQSFQLDAVTGNWRPVPAFAAPTGLTATPASAQVALSWDAAGSATSYTVQRATASAGPYTIIGSGLTSTSDTDSSLGNGTTYYYEVAAVNSTGTTSYTLPVSAVPSASPAPGAPGELAAAANNSQVSLSWDLSPGATTYILQRATAANGTYGTVYTGTNPVYTDTNATYGTTYYYEVAATNGTTTSTESPPVNVNLTGNITWTGTSNNTWDDVTDNWLYSSSPTYYLDGDTVNFTNAGTNTAISISNTVSPASMTFSNSTASYALSGASISGTGGLTVSGTGSVMLSGSNNYSGNTSVGSGGTLVVDNSYALQGSTLALTDGAVAFTANGMTPYFGGLQGSNAAQSLVLSSTAGPVALNVGGDGASTTYSGSVSGSGSLTKSGTGTLTLANATYTGATDVTGGTLNLTGSTGSTGAADFVNGGALYLSGATLAAASLENENESTVTLAAGSTISVAGALQVNGNNGDDNGVIVLVSGTFTANSATIGRDGDNLGSSPVTAGSTTDGLYVDGATVTIATSLDDGSTANNSSAQMRVDAGTVIVGGVTNVTNNAASRFSLLDLNGGTFTDNDTTGKGILLGGNANGSLDAELLTRGAAVVTTPAITLGNSSETGGLLEWLDIGGTVYIGSGGVVATSSTSTTVTVDLGSSSVSTAPTIGATAAWSSSVPMTLANSSGSLPVTFQTANAGGTPENITLAGALSGTGGLTETGGGTLTLSGDNTYTGTTNVLDGVLQMSGTLTNTTSLTVASGATFYLADGTLSVAGGITNNGIFKLSGTPTVSQTGSFINNGVLDLIDGPQTLPANFTNNGTVLYSNAVQVQQLGMNGSNFTLKIMGYAQHTYQLQRTSSLAAPVTWTNVGAPQAGTGSELTLSDTGAGGGSQAFYQILVSP